MWKYFVLGMLVGWVLEWMVDWLFWRRRGAGAAPADQSGGADKKTTVEKAAVERHGIVDKSVAAEAATLGDPPAAADDGEIRRPAVESNAGTTTSADTSAGRVGSEVALGAEGAVSTSSATLTSTAPVYREEDLEAIDGIGPKIGFSLRGNGITTFEQLAVTPIAEVERILASAGEPVPGTGPQAWILQARLAAAHDWSGLARMKAALREDDPASAT